MSQSPTSSPAANPLLEPVALPYGLPRLDRISNHHWQPAIEEGIAEHLRELSAILRNPTAVTFENTIVALERSGRTLQRIVAVFNSFNVSNTNSAIERLQVEMTPRLAAHSDAIFMGTGLFSRVRLLYERRDSLRLDPESRRLLERYYTLFVRAGAQLAAAERAKLKRINEQLSLLTTQFAQNVRKGTNAAAVVVDDVSDLDGLSSEQIAVAAEVAKARQLDGRWVLTLLNTTRQPALACLKSRPLRERIYKASQTRGAKGEYDTTVLITEIVKLRARRARLLGYSNHAAYVMEQETALEPQAVNRMLAQLAPAAVANARREAEEMQRLIAEQANGGSQPFELAAWDWDFYAEQVRRARYAYDESQLRPYFEMERVMRDGVLFAAQQLYGISFDERDDLPRYHPEVKVFEVFDRDRAPLGLLLLDWFARPNKRGGAWMSSYQSQSRLLGTRAIVINNLNIPKPREGEPTLLTFAEVTAAFHEFGHALHSLFSNVTYPLFSGTNVPHDFVEFPSQHNEMWATHPSVLANYAKHYRTGVRMPEEMLGKVSAAQKFNQGLSTTEYLAAAILDQAWHQLAEDDTPIAEDVVAFEAAALAKAGFDLPAVLPRYRSTYFQHIFGNSSEYSAGYYSYIWSEVLVRDTEQWFAVHGGLRRENGDLLRDKVLSKGFSADVIASFVDFYGKPPDIQPLLEARGLLGAATFVG